MFKSVLFSLSWVCLFGLNSCKNETQKGGDEKEVAATTSDLNYKVDEAKSVINWSGYSVNQGTQEEGSHYGIAPIKEGTFGVKEGKLVSGSIVVDMTGLKALDNESDKEANESLNTHLKNEDFFDVNAFPTARFEITSVTPLTSGDFNSEVEGNFTIKNITKNLKFNARVDVSDSLVSLKSDYFYINRQEFNITYSGAKDILIKDDFRLQVDISAVK